MNSLQWVNTAIVALGLPAIAGALVYIGGKLNALDRLEVSIEKAKHNLKVISDYLTKHHTKFNPAELQSISPLNLTPAGKQFIENTGFDNVFQEHRLEFLNFIDNEHPKLKYDVELAAIKSIVALSDKSFMNFIKVFLYNDPSRTMENTAPTLGVYIRDKYLAEHLEIKE